VVEVRPGLVLTARSLSGSAAAGHTHTTQGEALPCDLCVWAGGFKALPLARQAGLAVNARGQTLVDPYLRSISHPEILAAGDAAWPVNPAGAPVRMGLFTALVTGAHAANCLARMVSGRTPRPLGFSTYGQAIALGLRDAAGFNSYPNDRPVGPLFTGMTGLRLRNFFVWLLRAFLTLEGPLPGIFFWLGGGRGRATSKACLSAGEPASPRNDVR
jgi:NADH dehydrogenase FAD-containing subunit